MWSVWVVGAEVKLCRGRSAEPNWACFFFLMSPCRDATSWHVGSGLLQLLHFPFNLMVIDPADLHQQGSAAILMLSSTLILQFINSCVVFFYSKIVEVGNGHQIQSSSDVKVSIEPNSRPLLDVWAVRRVIYLPPLTAHCKLKSRGRNDFSWCAGDRLWLKKKHSNYC